MNVRTSIILTVLSAFLETCVPILVPAQTDSQMRAILLLSGAQSEEDLDETEIERYSSLLEHPLEINLASRRRLLSSGLLTQYQAASLTDYRLSSGDIRSLSELALVEGFGEEWVRTLAPFLSFRSRSQTPGAPVAEHPVVRNDLLSKGAIKDGGWNYGLKYRLSIEDRTEIALAARTAYADGGALLPSAYSLSILFYGRRHLGKLIAGDFSTRFGQGLCLWSGMSVSGFSGTASFSKRPSGLSPSWSFAGIGSHRGMAADFLFGRFVLSGFISFPGLRNWCEKGKPPEISVLPGGNLTWFGRKGQVSFTAFCATASLDRFRRLDDGRMIVLPEKKKGGSAEGNVVEAGKASLDFRFSIWGVDFSGEAARDFLNETQAFVAGAVVPLSEGTKLSLVLRSYPESFSSDFAGAVRTWSKTSNERGAGLGLERKGAVLTADLAQKDADRRERQCRLLLKLPFQLSDRLVLSFRGTEKMRLCGEGSGKTGMRLDLDYSSSGISKIYGPSEGNAWKARIRLEGQRAVSFAGLAYLEAGRKTDRFSSYLRGTVFLADNWDDRIYSYERDAPGNFSVPAYYGRGYSLSAVGSAKVRLSDRPFRTLKLYLRASMLRHPFMLEPRPSSFELKLQTVFDL